LILPFYVLAYILPLQKPKLDTYNKIINIFPLNAIHEGEYSCVDIFEQTMSFLLLSTHSLRQIVMLVRTPVQTLLSPLIHLWFCGTSIRWILQFGGTSLRGILSTNLYILVYHRRRSGDGSRLFDNLWFIVLIVLATDRIVFGTAA
jgi:hypothetical protein